MREIRFVNKIRNRRGASIVLALFAFMIVTMISTVIISAALTNVMRVRRQRLQEQAFLSVDSAAKLLQGMILADAEHSRAIVVKHKESTVGDVTTVTSDVSLSKDGANGSGDGAETDEMFASFGDILLAWVKTEDEYKHDAEGGGSGPVYDKTSFPEFQISVSALGNNTGGASDAFKPVTARMEKCEREVASEPNYDFKIILSVDDLGYEREITFMAEEREDFKLSEGTVPTDEKWYYVQWTKTETRRLSEQNAGTDEGESGS